MLKNIDSFIDSIGMTEKEIRKSKEALHSINQGIEDGTISKDRYREIREVISMPNGPMTASWEKFVEPHMVEAYKNAPVIQERDHRYLDIPEVIKDMRKAEIGSITSAKALKKQIKDAQYLKNDKIFGNFIKASTMYYENRKPVIEHIKELRGFIAKPENKIDRDMGM